LRLPTSALFAYTTLFRSSSKGFFSFVLEVLRDGRDYCSRKYSAIFTYASSLHNRNVGGDIGAIANFYILVNGSKRVNFYIFPDFSVRVQICQWMNHSIW